MIVESPAKAKKIGGYLGKDYVVMASMGHVRDLPNSAEAFYRKMPREPQPGFRVMYAGNIGAAQDFPTILAAAEKVPDVQWIILGDGRLRPWVESEVKKRGLSNVRLLEGPVLRSNFVLYRSRGDRLDIFPGHARHDLQWDGAAGDWRIRRKRPVLGLADLRLQGKLSLIL